MAGTEHDTITADEKEVLLAQARQRAGLSREPEPEQRGGPAVTATIAPTGQTQGVDVWGPYDDYNIVTTPYGMFGVPKGEELFFVPETEFSTRAKRMVTVHLPHYRNSKTGKVRA